MKYIDYIKTKISGRDFKTTCHGLEITYRIDANDIHMEFIENMYNDVDGSKSGYGVEIKNIVIISGGIFYDEDYTLFLDGIEINSKYLNRVLHSKIYGNVKRIIDTYRVGEYIRLFINHPNVKFI